MERQLASNFPALFEFLRDLYAFRDLDGFVNHALAALPRIVPAEHTTYNEVNLRRGRIASVSDRPDLRFPGWHEALERHLPEHPLVAHYQRHPGPEPVKISDLLPRAGFHRLGIYNEFFRRLGVEDQLGLLIATPPPLLVGIVLNRGRPDFSERERLIVSSVRPHLEQAYRNAVAVTNLTRRAGTIRQALEALNFEVIALARTGRILAATPQALGWLALYFGPVSGRDRLPDPLERWVRQQDHVFASRDRMPAVPRPLRIERADGCLIARWLSDGPDRLLVLERRQKLDPVSLESLGLTRREAEVLAWVAEGKTNEVIAGILAIAPRTVGKHLERIYPKLGVETRTAAAARAFEVFTA